MRIAALALLLLASLGAGLEPRPLPVSPAEKVSREGAQWVQADAGGRAVLLDGVTLLERRFQDGGFRDPQPLTQAAVTQGVVRGAARSRDGDAWLFDAPPWIRYFVGGEEKRLAQPSRDAIGVGFHDGRPIVAVGPHLLGWVRPPGFDASEATPLVMVYSGDDWETLLERRDLIDEDGIEAQLDSMLVFATDSKRNLWIAHRYRYRIYQLSPSGKLRLTLEVDHGAQVSDEATEKEREAALAALLEDFEESESGVSSDPSAFIPIMQNPLLNGIVAGLDGNIYLFNSGAKADFPSLDRYNPYTNTLERLAVRLDYRGLVSMAAARDGLLLAGYTVGSGPWMIPWEQLEAAKWEPIEGATADGVPLLPPEKDE